MDPVSAPFVQRYGISVIVSNDLFSYKVVAEKLQLEHQVRQFHIRRWVGKTFKELHTTLLEEGLWVLEKIRELMDFLQTDGNKNCMCSGSNSLVDNPNHIIQ